MNRPAGFRSSRRGDSRKAASPQYSRSVTVISRFIIVLLAFGGLAGGGSPVRAQNLPTAVPESVGLSSERLDEATRGLQSHVDAGDIAGVVAAVARHGQLVYLESLGELDRERGLAMRDDALFRLYSMTRPITSLAAMILWEEDRFELDDPVSMYLPEFADQRVFADASNPDLTATRPRRAEMTVEHLLLHTSGLGSRSSSIYRAEQVRLRSITLPQMVGNAARVPLFEDPGTRWRYGISTTILGRLVEVWSGLPFDEFLQERIFEPLGMTDTVFRVDAPRADRFGPAYRPGPDGELRPHAIEVVPFTDQPALIEGGVGLVSTVRDYLRFSQMFLNGGELDGVRVLQPATVALMTVNRVPDALLPIGFGSPQPGRGWTLGFCVVMDADASPLPVPEGTFWWDGSSGTRFFIDPVQDMVTVIMAAASPAYGNGFREGFVEAVYQSLVD
ncbi:MAG: beta-lactamase family protein [Acidobacteria bacterium]|nr:beta-lactamase family protein [Acidobacteriota bacterium]